MMNEPKLEEILADVIDKVDETITESERKADGQECEHLCAFITQNI